MSLKLLVESFFTDHLKHKAVNKTTMKPRQLCAHQLEHFPTGMINF